MKAVLGSGITYTSSGVQAKIIKRALFLNDIEIKRALVMLYLTSKNASEMGLTGVAMALLTCEPSREILHFSSLIP